MNAFRKSAAMLALSTFLVPAGALPAAALDAEQFGERLKAVFAGSQGMVIDWSGISADDDTVTLEGVTLGLPGEGEKVAIGDLTLDEVSEEDGGYRVGSVELPQYLYEQAGARVAVDGLSISGLTVPGEGASGPLGELMVYERAALKSASVTVEGKELFTLSDLHAEITLPEGDEPLAFTAAAERFSIDTSAADDANVQEMAQALGLTIINGNIQMAGSWSPRDGLASVDQYDLKVDNAGTLGISLEVSGYTPEFIKALQDIQRKMAEASEEEQSAQGLAMLGLMQQLNFHNATIRFDDDTLTGKVLDYLAKQQGAKPADIANQAKAVLPFALMQLNNPEFAASVTAAVSAFLDNPQSLAVSANPASPVPFALLAAGAMTAPESLVKQLAVTVTANE